MSFVRFDAGLTGLNFLFEESLTMKRLMGLTSLVLALVLVSSGAAQEQQQQRRGFSGGAFAGFSGPGGGPLSLVSNEAVQKELGLNDEQIAGIRKLAEESRAELRGAFGDFGALRNLPEAERAAKMAELRTKMEENAKKINEKVTPKLNELLTEAQRDRLKQLQRQSAGVSALLQAELQETLKLTQEQKDKLAAIMKNAEEKQAELRRKAMEGEAREIFSQMREAREARDKELAGVLTEEQAKQYDALKGKPFDMAQLRRGFGGPGGGGRRPDGEGGQRPRRPESSNQ
jgi:Spy/CpxP family protein refolding chaperone